MKAIGEKRCALSKQDPNQCSDSQFWTLSPPPTTSNPSTHMALCWLISDFSTTVSLEIFHLQNKCKGIYETGQKTRSASAGPSKRKVRGKKWESALLGSKLSLRLALDLSGALSPVETVKRQIPSPQAIQRHIPRIWVLTVIPGDLIARAGLAAHVRPRMPSVHGDSTLALVLGPPPHWGILWSSARGFSRQGGDLGLAEFKRVISRLRGHQWGGEAEGSHG